MLVKRARLLHCLTTAYTIELLLYKKIADEEYIKDLKDKSENENTTKSTEYWKNVLKKWENERNLQANLEE